MVNSTDSAYLADEGVSLGLSLGYGQLDNPVYKKEDIALFALPRIEIFAGDFSFANTQFAWTPIWGDNCRRWYVCPDKPMHCLQRSERR